MTTYVALLRGVNVGGHKKLPMADLRTALCSVGCANVRTYLQSGNAVFTSDREDAAALTREIRAHVAATLGLDVGVLLRTREELAAVVASNPFPVTATAGAKVHVVFLSANPSPEQWTTVDPASFAPDEFRLGDRAVYVWYPNGAGRSKLTLDVWERRLGVCATARNWNTVTKLLAL